MSIAIVGMGTARSANLDELKTKPEFRKATLNMMLAACSQDEALAPLIPLFHSDTLASSMMILGSSYGELGVTISFLEHLSQSGVARPFLFQNSLHNSTLGFLAMRLTLKGPAFTVSNSMLTGENSLELGSTMLNDPKKPLCIVTCVDSLVTHFRLDNDKAVGSQGEGAATLVLARRQTAEEQGWPILALFNRVDYSVMPAEAGIQGKTKYPGKVSSVKQGGCDLDASLRWHDKPNAYHSDAIERVVEHLSTKSPVAKITLPKSDGRQTVIHFEPRP